MPQPLVKDFGGETRPVRLRCLKHDCSLQYRQEDKDACHFTVHCPKCLWIKEVSGTGRWEVWAFASNAYERARKTFIKDLCKRQIDHYLQGVKE